jgi:hypothetical protein
MKFAVAVLYQKLSSKRLLCENRLSDCHTYRKAIHSVVF